MKLYNNSILVIFCISFLGCCYSQSSLSPIHGAFIYDLRDTAPRFASYLSQWTVHGAANPSLVTPYTCIWPIFGQPGLLNVDGSFERIYSNLPPHNFVFYYIALFIIDDWVASDYYEIIIDDNPFFRGYPQNTRATSTSNVCGNTAQMDAIDVANGIFSHTSTTLKLKVFSHVTNSPTNAWLGIKNIIISFSNGTSFPQTKCSFASSGAEKCPCNGATYYDPTNPSQCSPCHASCSDCFGPSDQECYACSFPIAFDGVRCRDPQAPNCIFFDFVKNQCSECATGYMLYWDGSCRLSTCPSPYTLETIVDFQFCKTPCQSNNTYMFWNNTCISNCNFPLVKRIEGDGMFCDYPCNTAASEYLYSNGSCSTSCVFFPRIEGGYKFCDHCPVGSYMYPNGTCIPSCNFPRRSKVEGGYYYCLSSCEGSLKYYYPKDHKCRETCEYPNRVEDEIFCSLDLSQEVIEALSTVSDIQESAGHMRNITVLISRIVSVSNPSAVLFGSLGDILMYIKYLRIDYPPKLQYILDQPESEGILQGILSIPKALEELFEQRNLPEQFERYEVRSSFFVNFWEAYFTMLIVGTVILIICFIKCYMHKYPLIKSPILRLEQMFKWNLLISFMIGYFGDLGFYAYLEMKSVQFDDSFWSIISFIFSVLTTIFAIALLIKMLLIIHEIITMKKQDSRSMVSNRVTLTKDKWKEYQVIFNNFKEDSFAKLAFIPIFVIRLYLFNIIVVSLFDHPLVQTLLITLMSFVMLVYLIISRPFKEKKNMIENLVQEGALQVVNICVLILASLDLANCEAIEVREVLGNIIIGVDTGFSLLGSIYLNIQLFWSIIKLCSNIRKKRQQKAQVAAEKVSQPPNVEAIGKNTLEDCRYNSDRLEKIWRPENPRRVRAKIIRPNRQGLPTYKSNISNNQIGLNFDSSHRKNNAITDNTSTKRLGT